jgi:hypothetical protein
MFLRRFDWYKTATTKSKKKICKSCDDATLVKLEKIPELNSNIGAPSR